MTDLRAEAERIAQDVASVGHTTYPLMLVIVHVAMRVALTAAMDACCAEQNENVPQSISASCRRDIAELRDSLNEPVPSRPVISRDDG